MKTIKYFIVILALALQSQSVSAQDTKIGILNAIQALFNSDAARVVQQELEQEFAQDEQRANELTEELTALQEQYQQNEAVMSEDEVLRMNSDAQDLQVQLQLMLYLYLLFCNQLLMRCQLNQAQIHYHVIMSFEHHQCNHQRLNLSCYQ